MSIPRPRAPPPRLGLFQLLLHRKYFSFSRIAALLQESTCCITLLYIHLLALLAPRKSTSCVENFVRLVGRYPDKKKRKEMLLRFWERGQRGPRVVAGTGGWCFPRLLIRNLCRFLGYQDFLCTISDLLLFTWWELITNSEFYLLIWTLALCLYNKDRSWWSPIPLEQKIAKTRQMFAWCGTKKSELSRASSRA